MDFSTLLLAICDAYNNQTILCVSQIRSLFCEESSTCFPMYLKSKVLFLPMWLDTGQLQQVSHWLPLFPSIILPQPQWPSRCSSNMPSMFLLWKLRTCCSFCPFFFQIGALLTLFILVNEESSNITYVHHPYYYYPHEIPSLSIPILLACFIFPQAHFIVLSLFPISPQWNVNCERTGLTAISLVPRTVPAIW